MRIASCSSLLFWTLTLNNGRNPTVQLCARASCNEELKTMMTIIQNGCKEKFLGINKVWSVRENKSDGPLMKLKNLLRIILKVNC